MTIVLGGSCTRWQLSGGMILRTQHTKQFFQKSRSVIKHKNMTPFQFFYSRLILMDYANNVTSQKMSATFLSSGRRCSQGAYGAMLPQFLVHIVILCFKRRYPKQNIVIRIKSNIWPPPQIFLPPTKIFGLATLVYLAHVSCTAIDSQACNG